MRILTAHLFPGIILSKDSRQVINEINEQDYLEDFGNRFDNVQFIEIDKAGEIIGPIVVGPNKEISIDRARNYYVVLCGPGNDRQSDVYLLRAFYVFSGKRAAPMVFFGVSKEEFRSNPNAEAFLKRLKAEVLTDPDGADGNPEYVNNRRSFGGMIVSFRRISRIVSRWLKRRK